MWYDSFVDVDSGHRYLFFKVWSHQCISIVLDEMFSEIQRIWIGEECEDSGGGAEGKGSRTRNGL